MPAVSKQQQKLFGLALAFKRGEIEASEVSDEVQNIADRMSEKDIEDFAATKHKELPKMKEQLRKIVREIMRERVISELTEENPCWKGYKQLGMKTKDGKKVPNCVKESVNESFISNVGTIDTFILKDLLMKNSQVLKLLNKKEKDFMKLPSTVVIKHIKKPFNFIFTDGKQEFEFDGKVNKLIKPLSKARKAIRDYFSKNESVNEASRISRGHDFYGDDDGTKHGKAIHSLLNGKWNSKKVENYLEKLGGGNDVKHARIIDFISKDAGLNPRKYKTLGEQLPALIKQLKVLYKDFHKIRIVPTDSLDEGKPKIKNTISKKDWSKLHKSSKHIGSDGTHYIMKYDDKIGTHLQAVKLVNENLSSKRKKKSITEGKFKKDDLVYNKRTKTVGIVRLGDDKYGEVKTDADGNVNVDELEKYNPIKFKHQTKAKVAPSTEKEVSKRGLFNPFKNESVNEVRKVSKPIKVDDDTMVQIVGDNKGFRELTATLNPKTGKPIQKFGFDRGNEIANSKEELIKKLQKKYGKSIKFESVVNEGYSEFIKDISDEILNFPDLKDKFYGTTGVLDKEDLTETKMFKDDLEIYNNGDHHSYGDLKFFVNNLNSPDREKMDEIGYQFGLIKDQLEKAFKYHNTTNQKIDNFSIKYKNGKGEVKISFK